MARVYPQKSSLYAESLHDGDNTEFDMSLDEMNLRRRISSKNDAPKKNFLFISDPIRVKWDVCVIVLAVYNCFSIPYTVSFIADHETPFTLDVLDSIIDLIFIFDIYLNFITSYIDMKTGDEITDKRKIAHNYIRSGRLAIDILASVPFDLIALIFGDVNSTLSLIKLLKLLRILRLGKIIYYMRVKEDIKMSFRIFRMILFILVYLHFLACSWNALVSVEERWVQPTDLVLGNTKRFYSASVLHRYFFSYYTALGTLVKYEVYPSTKYEYLFCMFWIIVGALIISYLLGEISVLVANLNRTMASFFHAMDTISTAMKNLKLPEHLQLRITQYFISTHQILLHHKEWEKFQRIVPPSWIRKINLHLYKDIVSLHPVFSKYTHTIEGIVMNLEYKFLMPDNYLIEAGTESTFFCFVVKGVFEVWVKGIDTKEYLVRELYSGQYCGEVGLLYNVERTSTVRAIHYCSVGLLSRSFFTEMLSNNRELEQELKERASNYKDPYRKQIFVRVT